MAKSRTIIRTVGVPVRPSAAPIIRIAAPAALRSTARRAGKAARRGARAAYSAAAGEKHTITALMASAGLAIAEQHGYGTLMGFPSDVAGGLIAWVGGRMTKNRTAEHVATGLLCVAVHRMMGGGKVSGDGRAVAFDDD